MKKIIANLILFTAFCSVFGVDKEKLKENLSNSQHLTELMMDEEYVKKQKAIAEEKKAKKEIETELTDELLGIKYHAEDYHILKKNFLRVELSGPKGNFNIFAQNEDDESALFSVVDSFASTSFYVKIDRKIYRLNENNAVKREIRRLSSDNEAQISYIVDKTVRVTVDFTLIASRPDHDEDIVQIKVYLINLTDKKKSAGLLALLDTWCGEGVEPHFTTAANKKIRYETQFSAEDMETQRCINVSNKKNNFQILLNGNGITPVKSVTLANVDILKKMLWNGTFVSKRGFSNNRAYADSAVMIVWDDMTLNENELNHIDFYIAASNDEELPYGLQYIDGIEEPEKEIKKEAVKTAEKKPAENKIKEPKKEENNDKRTDVEFIVPSVKAYQLDPVYIQSLIDKIDSLQSSSDANPAEIQRLNAELDAILEKLRQH
ncbi:hypothetical protein [Treponema sp.]|uniref:hypothetical protein n=1 Tax=Treponema sp. TaxID=166 RepID=UPI00388E6672